MKLIIEIMDEADDSDNDLYNSAMIELA